MLREKYHPNARLVSVRNVRPGLRARTKILNVLEAHATDAKTTADEAAMRYRAVLHHLKLLKSEGIVRREGGKPSVWVLTGVGQKRLMKAG
jgi:predicted transcriptional regulator